MVPLRLRLLIAFGMVSVAATLAARQGGTPRAALPFTVISPEGRRPLAASLAGDQVVVALDDVAALFQAAVREDALAGGVTVTLQGEDRHPHPRAAAGVRRGQARVASVRARPRRSPLAGPGRVHQPRLRPRLRRKARRAEERAPRARRRRASAPHHGPLGHAGAPDPGHLQRGAAHALHRLPGTQPRHRPIRCRRARRHACRLCRPRGCSNRSAWPIPTARSRSTWDRDSDRFAPRRCPRTMGRRCSWI